MEAGVETLRFGSARLVEEASNLIVAAARCGGDLSRVTVLLPDLHAAPAFARALHRALAGEPALLPRLTSLRSWAAETPLDGPIASATAREAAIFHALAERSWFERADLWTVAGELAVLFDELTRWHVGLPASAADFARRLERAYQARAGATFAFEATLVHELWHAIAAGTLGGETAYPLRLSRLARGVTDPIYVVAPGRVAPAERDFLERCAQRVAVIRIVPALAADCSDALERTLHAAWPVAASATLLQRAEELRASAEAEAISGRVRFFGAHEAEEEAAAAASAVRAWLQAGRTRIGVVTLDRVVARRARALLERSQILVRDEAGWPLSTTSAAAAIGRWFDLVGNDCYHRDLLDLLKSPFAFADWPRSQRRRTVARLERELRHANVKSGYERFVALAEAKRDAPLLQMLERVQRAAAALARTRRKTLAEWLAALERALRDLGVRQGFETDAAGVQILELLAEAAYELRDESVAVDIGDFRRWIARRLESASFRDPGIESPVVFTSLEATRLRSFDAVLIIGADASSLPGDGAGAMFFNQRVRRDLGLPGFADHIEDVQEMLRGLMTRAAEVLITWQRTQSGEPNLVSPLFERLRTLHELAWDDDLEATGLAITSEPTPRDLRAAMLPPPTAAPAPRVPAPRVPASITASGYNTLMGCPYKFYARHVLALRESEEVQEELDKSDYGTRVHAVLTAFHRAHPSLLALPPAAGEAALREFSERAFRDDIGSDYVASAWLARWRAIIPAYIAWQRRHELQGWSFSAGEIERSVTIETPSGRTIALKGRIDRIDVRGDGAVTVVDYKTSPSAKLKSELGNPGEDVQLPVYALLWGAAIDRALYLPVDSDPVEPVEIGQDVAAHADEVRARLCAIFDRMAAGAPMPAQGIDKFCRFCEMGGLCRRKHWP